jgi:hypothetical protein
MLQGAAGGFLVWETELRPRSCSNAAGAFHCVGQCCNTRVRCRIVSLMRGRCLVMRSKYPAPYEARLASDASTILIGFVN